MSGAKIPGRRAALAADVWNFEQPRPRWVAEHMRRPTGRMFFTVLKDICSLGQSYLCVSAVSPLGTHRGRGCVNSPTTPRNALWSADFRATSSPPLWREGTRESTTRPVYASGSYRTHVFLGAKEVKVRAMSNVRHCYCVAWSSASRRADVICDLVSRAVSL